MVNKQKYILPSLIILVFITFMFWIGSFSKISILVDNKEFEYWTKSDTVKEVVKELDSINLSPLDLVKPDLNSKITEGLTISIIRVREAKVIFNENIPYDTEYKNDNNILNGQKKIIKKGQKGIFSKTYLITYYDDIEQTKKLIKEDIIAKPTTEVIAVGTKQTVQRAGKILDIKKTLTMKSTAYTHTGNKTSTGIWPTRGTVAVDSSFIPLGSKMYIDGYGFAVAQDIGSAIKGERIDLFMETKTEALKWETRTVRVYILN